MVLVVEYIVFILLVATNLFVGLYVSFRKANAGPGSKVTAAEVFLGSRMLKPLPLAASSVVSLFSSTGLIGLPAHYYAYGWHMAWHYVTPLFCIPLGTHVFVPVLYRLRITSIFEYIRQRFNATISLTACMMYIFLTLCVGALSVHAASLALLTVFNIPLIWCNVLIGMSGTLYTALGGLRGVVWTDCLQFFFILVAPTTVVAKIVMDSISASSPIEPLSNLDIRKYIAETTFTSALLINVFYFAALSLGVSMTIWFRGCDPSLTGAISSTDQIIPYYVKTYLLYVPGFSGLFLGGVVSAATSTVSSTVNSQAAILYVDVIVHHYKNAEKHVRWITRGTALALGIAMTLLSMLCAHMGSLSRSFLMVYNGMTAPFVGLCLLGVFFPFVRTKGAGVATLAAVAYQLIHISCILRSGRSLPRMATSFDYCLHNHTGVYSPHNMKFSIPEEEQDEDFTFSRLSYMWSSFFAIFGTILLGMIVSAITGEIKSKEDVSPLCWDYAVRFWKKSNLLPKHQSGEATMVNCSKDDQVFLTQKNEMSI